MSLCVTLKSWTCGPCASLPTGMSIHVKKAKADRPAETFQEAAYLLFHFLFRSLSSGNHFWGWDFRLFRTSQEGPAAIPFAASRHFPPPAAWLQLGAAGACWAVIPSHFHSPPLVAGPAGLHGQRCHHLLWPPSGSKHWSRSFTPSPALFRVMKSHLWNQCVCQQADTYGKQMLLTVESPEVLA